MAVLNLRVIQSQRLTEAIWHHIEQIKTEGHGQKESRQKIRRQRKKIIRKKNEVRENLT